MSPKYNFDDLDDIYLASPSQSVSTAVSKNINRLGAVKQTDPAYDIYRSGSIPIEHGWLLEYICNFIPKGKTIGVVPMKYVMRLSGMSYSKVAKIMKWLEFFGIVECKGSSREGTVIEVRKRPEEFKNYDMVE